ncbi:MAG TPA: hypothetical protein PKV16_03915 [Caldisericia bacterium]|nr:hypothetical protein [Caldisericia bacterium]HPF48456.1 hypothetical protein [Caldisericia bacterium]HPI83364.1 hypothetical protein [Caldisericia bacterium]HPQ92910.1 hypothetical protein [Caldisericia bacterium]HRV73992.1 hypothetical protein [Caldisericia bacterium]
MYISQAWLAVFGLAVVVLAVAMLLMDRRLKNLEDSFEEIKKNDKPQ